MSKDRLRTIFRDEFNIEVPDDDTHLFEEGLLDSLIFVELLVRLEGEFGVSVSLEDLEIEQFRSLSTIASYVDNAGQKTGSGEI